MKESGYKSYEDLPLFLNAATVAKVLGVSPSSGYELMLVVAKSTPLHPAYMPGGAEWTLRRRASARSRMRETPPAPLPLLPRSGTAASPHSFCSLILSWPTPP